MLTKRPAQIHTRKNLRGELWDEIKPIKTLRVLSLNDRASSWYQDAQNCCRIYTRMVRAKALCPRLVPLMSRWARVLIWYSEAYETCYPVIICNKKDLEEAKKYWMYNMLTEISKIRSINDMVDDKFCSFKVHETYAVKNNQELCAISHRVLSQKRAVRWKTKLVNGVEMISSPTYADTFTWLEERIMSGLKRHRSKKTREILFTRIWRVYHDKQFDAHSPAKFLEFWNKENPRIASVYSGTPTTALRS